MIAGWLQESASGTVISRLRDMVNKKTESRVLRIGDKFQSVSLAQASYLVQMYDNQDDKEEFEAALNDKKEYESILKTVKKYVKESYTVSYKGQPFAYFDTESEAKKHLEKYAKKGDASSYKVVKEETDLNESDYKVMHKTFTDAVSAAKEKAEKAGYTIDDDEWFRKVSSGPRKPGTDKTNRYSLELLTKRGGPAKKALHFQVYNTGRAYELNAYIN